MEINHSSGTHTMTKEVFKEIPPAYSARPSDHHTLGHTVDVLPITTAIHQPTTMVPAGAGLIMGPKPANMTCKACNLKICTTVVMKPVKKTHISALVLCLIGCIPCACLPYCMTGLNNHDHFCPNCSTYIGSYIC